MTESNLTRTPRALAVAGDPENRGPARGGTDPATLSGAMLSALEDLKRARLELGMLVSWEADHRVLTTLGLAINDVGIDVLNLSNAATAKAEHLLEKES